MTSAIRGAEEGAHANGAVIVGEDVDLAYGTRVAVSRATFTIPGAAITVLIGSNGSGKSTLMNAITGLCQPVRGRLDIFGRPAPAEPESVAYVLQETAVNDLLPVTVQEVVAMGRFARRGLLGRLRQSDQESVARAMERLEVAELTDRRLNELSGGQRQRVLVAQGLAQEAEILLLDEPVTGLDLVSRQQIVRAMVDEKKAGRAVVLATHDLKDAELADHVLLLAGHVVAEGPPSEVLTSERLRKAYGARLVQIDAHDAVLDDHHFHGHPTGSDAEH